MMKLHYKKTVLKNGLRVITVPMKNTSTVTSIVFVKTGSRYERKEENGISHVLEHMFFQGTKKRPDKMSVKRELDRVGAQSNAFTAHDHTAYYVKAEAKHLDLSLDILSDMYLNALFRPQAIEKEQRVVVEEINMYKDTPTRQVWDNFWALLYPAHPLGWSILGPPETVLSLKRNNFLSYVKKFYAAANTVVMVAGNVEAETVVAKVRRYLRALHDAPPSTFDSFYDTQERSEVHLQYKHIDQAHIVVGMKAYPVGDKRRYPLEVLRCILGGYFSSRLVMRVRDMLGLAYYVGADTAYHEDTGHFAAYAGLNVRNIDVGIKAILREFHKAAERLIAKKEIEDAKSHIEGALSLHIESSDAVAMDAGTSEVLEGRVETPQEYLRQIRKVGASDLRHVAQELFKTSRLNLALIGPFKDKSRFERLLKVS